METCAAAAAEGSRSYLTQSCAKLGDKKFGNSNRDFRRHAQRRGRPIGLGVTCVSAPFLAVRSGEDEVVVADKDVGMLYPHELMHCLFTSYHRWWHTVFVVSAEAMASYWEHARGTEWFRNLPSAVKDDIASSHTRWSPLRIHGDDHPVKKALTGMSVNLSCPLSWFVTTVVSIFPVFFLLLKELAEDTVETVMARMVWSFGHLLNGKMPDRDDRGFPLVAGNRGVGAWRHRVRGRDIAGGMRFLVTELAGDMKWLREVLHLFQSYLHTEICHLCFATKTLLGGKCFTDFRDAASHRAPRRTHAAFMATFLARLGFTPALCTLAGFHIEMILFDWLHAFLLGVAQWCLGNCLMELLEANAFGRFRGNMRFRYGLQLRIAFCRFKTNCTRHSIQHSQPMFTVGLLGFNGKKCRLLWPDFKGKGANTGAALRWLASELEARPVACEHDRVRKTCVMAYNTAHCILMSNPMFFQNGSERDFRYQVQVGLLTNEILAREAHAFRRSRWQLKPKHHAVDEMSILAVSTKRNPRSYWCMKGEDFMGISSRVTSRGHPSTVSHDALERWLLNLRFPSNWG